jgi:ADP-heptose:LPS heptosyltransferase
MMLLINDPRERAVVAAADALLRPVALWRRLRARPRTAPARVLCLRLERIGDLLMTLPALAELRALLPDARIDLAVGSWNAEIAAAIPGVDAIERLDAAWLARGGEGRGTLALARQAAAWRGRGYDLAINFEPDIRSNLITAAAGARRTAGFASSGGGAVLDTALAYDPSAHTADNAIRLVRRALGADDGPLRAATLRIPDAHRAEAARLLAPLAGSRRIGMHVSGGRAIKQWPEARFHELAARLAADREAALVFTGTTGDRAQVAEARAGLPDRAVLDLTGAGLLTVAAVIERLDLFVTGDTGPMHLAHAVGTPIVAVFGPSDPARYAPRGLRDRVVRVDLPCSPCNRIRRPPTRCVGHTPDCLRGVEVAAVMAAIDEVLGVDR